MAKNSSSPKAPKMPVQGAIKPGAMTGGSAHKSTMSSGQGARLNSGLNRSC